MAGLTWSFSVALAITCVAIIAAVSCSEDDAGSGGYAANADAERELAGGDACDIPRLASLSEAEFNATYRLHRPFVLVDVAQPRHRVNFSKNALRRVYGDVRVRTGIAREIIRRGGSGYRGMSLRHFIEAMEAAGTVGERGDTLYLFDKGQFFEQAPHLAAQLEPMLADTPFGTATRLLYLAMGGAFSGTQFHHHADAWNLQLFGRKRWLLYAPEDTPPRLYPPQELGIRRWIHDFLPSLLSPSAKRQPGEKPPLSCVVEAGDLIYIPDGWYHATVNLGEGVGVAAQSVVAQTKLQALWDETGRNDMSDHDKLQAYAKIQELSDGRNQEARYTAGTTRFFMGDIDGALATAAAALALAPSYSNMHYLVGRLRLKKADLAARSGRPRDAYMPDLQLALHAFEQCERFFPHDTQSLEQHEWLLKFLGRTEEAAEISKRRILAEKLLGAEDAAERLASPWPDLMPASHSISRE